MEREGYAACSSHAWDVWHCHGSRAGDVGCVALPRFSRSEKGRSIATPLFA